MNIFDEHLISISVEIWIGVEVGVLPSSTQTSTSTSILTELSIALIAKLSSSWLVQSSLAELRLALILVISTPTPTHPGK